MRIALDATPLSAGTGGIVRYVSELHQALRECYPTDDFALVEERPRNWLERRWWLVGLPCEMKRRGIDVFHGCDFAAPYLPLRPSVVTLHDLSPWKNAAWHSEAGRVRRRTPFLLRLGIATLVLTPTEAIRREAIEYFALNPSRVMVTPLAAARHFRRVETQRWNYLLFVGTLEPRKNLERLVEAWRMAHQRTGVELILAGRRRADGPQFAPTPGLHVVGRVTEEELTALYSGAIACVYPSSYEGFGLPVLEAMQCGAAVLTSRDAAIAEVAGDAAVRIEATDVRAWADAMTRAATDQAWLLGWRERALRRAAEFTWARTARLTYEAYLEARRRFGN